jgi:DNA (cytosine-5)-methyltransferase 1
MGKINYHTPMVGDFRYDEGFRPRKDNEVAPTVTRGNGGKECLSGSILIHSLFPRSGNPEKGGTGHLCKQDGASYCVDTMNAQAIEKEGKVRRLSPRECFRLMGFLNDEIKLDGISDSAAYKLAGNGWEINVASLVLKNMLEEELI